MDTLKFIVDKFNLKVRNDKYTEIPNVGRYDLVKLFRELDFKVGVEIGVAFGNFSKTICDINPQMKLYGVDPWESYHGYKDYTKPQTFSAMKRETLRQMEISIRRGRYEIIEMFSKDALKEIKDNSCDFVYIDGNHELSYVYDDIVGWSKKVKVGGIISGHDFTRVKRLNFGIKDALQKYIKENNINPWFVLGSDAVIPNMVRDGSRSWMFVKQ